MEWSNMPEEDNSITYEEVLKRCSINFNDENGIIKLLIIAINQEERSITVSNGTDTQTIKDTDFEWDGFLYW